MQHFVSQGLPLYRFEMLHDVPGVATFVTTRNACDAGDFDMGLYAGGDSTAIEAHLGQLCNALGIDRNHLVFPQQTHTAAVAVVDEALMALSPQARREALYARDAVVTHLPGVAIAVATADCVPILLYDPTHRVVAAIHAGWRGTVAKIVDNTIDVMCSRYGCRPGDLYAAIGPCIGGEAYEVGEELVERFTAAGFDIDALVTRPTAGGRPHIDLAAANTQRLLQRGVDLQRIEVCGICTRNTSHLFYSVRASGATTGRFLSGIVLRDDRQ